MSSTHAQRSGRDVTVAALADGPCCAIADGQPENEDTP